MGEEVVLFESEERKQLSEVAEYLHQLADRLAQHEVTLGQGEDGLTLNIPDQVVLEIKVEEEEEDDGIEQSLEIEIEWMKSETGASSEEEE